MYESDEDFNGIFVNIHYRSFTNFHFFLDSFGKLFWSAFFLFQNYWLIEIEISGKIFIAISLLVWWQVNMKNLPNQNLQVKLSLHYPPRSLSITYTLVTESVGPPCNEE